MGISMPPFIQRNGNNIIYNSTIYSLKSVAVNTNNSNAVLKQIYPFNDMILHNQLRKGVCFDLYKMTFILNKYGTEHMLLKENV